MNTVTMELPKKELGHRGATLKEIAVKHLIDSRNDDPCNHMDKLLATEDLYEDLYDDLKNGFCEKYKGCLPDKTIYNRCINKSIIKNNNTSVYVLEKNCIKELDIQSGSVLHIVDEYTPHQYNHTIITDAIANNEILISGTVHGIIQLWDSNTRECIKVLENGGGVGALAAEHKDFFCSVSSKKIKIWDIKSGLCFSEVGRHNDKNYVAPCMLKKDMLYVVNDNDVVQCDLRSGKHSVLLTSNNISAIADSSQCPFSFFSGSKNCKVQWWDMRNTTKPVCLIKTGYAVNAVVVKDKTLYAALSAGWGGNHPHPGIQVFDMLGEKLSLVNNLPGEGWINNLQVNDAGLYVAGSFGLTVFPDRSYEKVYNALKKINTQKALEYSKK